MCGFTEKRSKHALFDDPQQNFVNIFFLHDVFCLFGFGLGDPLMLFIFIEGNGLNVGEVDFAFLLPGADQVHKDQLQ